MTKQKGRGKKEQYYWLVAFFGDRDLGPLTLREFYKGCKELEWPIPKLHKDIGGSLRMRVYNGDYEAIYEGHPEFDYKTWLYKGARWVTVFEPATDEDVKRREEEERAWREARGVERRAK